MSFITAVGDAKILINTVSEIFVKLSDTEHLKFVFSQLKVPYKAMLSIYYISNGKLML